MTDTKAQTITITVDGKQIEAKPGELLIAAAERAGIFIPRFCWHKRMDPVGACRMCLVDVEGSPPIPGTPERRPQTSCTTVVRDGMVVYTQFSSRADQHRAEDDPRAAADQPPPRLSDLRPRRRVSAAGPGAGLRAGRVEVHRAEAALP